MKTVGRYQLLRTIGRGGMATVYLARQTDLDREVALKELRLFDRSEPQLARRFLREARLAGSFSHPNIVTVHDYLEHDGVPYIAMEFLPRGSLRSYVGRLSLAQVGGVLEGVLGGLAHAEERGVLHRDLKPENIMVTTQGWVKIADFGIAKATSATQTTADLTTTGTTLGTPRYMAPERALGQEIGPWSDLYSVGVIVFELLVGRTPFQDTEAPMAILMRQINDPIPPVTSLVPDVDPALSDWVERLLAKDPAARTRSATAARDELDEILFDLAGPHWLREAGLPARPGDAPLALPGTPGRVAAATPATVRAAPAPTSPTVSFPGGGDELATVAPDTIRAGSEPAGAPAPRRRVAPAAWLAVLLAALLIGVAAAASGGGGQNGGDGTGARRANAAVVDRALRELRRASRAHATQLASASTPQERGRAARALAGDYRDAAAPLEGRAGARRLVQALNETARVYDEAAAAAGRGDAAAYEAALGRAGEAEAALDGELAGRQGQGAARDDSGVGDSRSDDPSDDEPDEDENGA